MRKHLELQLNKKGQQSYISTLLPFYNWKNPPPISASPPAHYKNQLFLLHPAYYYTSWTRVL